MAKFEVTIEGQPIIVEAKDEIEAQQLALRQIPSAMPQPQQPQPKEPKPQTTFTQDVMRGLRDPYDALRQLKAKTEPFVLSAGGLLPNKYAEFAKQEGEQVMRDVQAQEQEYKQAGGGDLSAGRMLGNIVNPLNMIPGAAIARGVTAAGPLMRAGMIGATGGLMSPATSEDIPFAAEKAIQVGAGTALGPIVEKAAGVVAPRITEAAQTLREAGVKNLTPGQAYGGFLQRIEQGLSSIPWIGDFVSGAQRRNIQDFDRAVYDKVLGNINKKVPSNLNGQDAFKFADDQISDAYNTLVPKLSLPQTVIVGRTEQGGLQTLDDQINSIVSAYKQDLPEKTPDYVSNIINNYYTKKIAKGDMSGKDLKALESTISKEINKYYRSSEGTQKEAGNTFLKIQGALRDAIETANPEYRGELQPINRAFGELQIIKKAASSTAAEEGVFSPKQLQTAVKASDPTRGSQVARGEARLQELAEAGVSALGSKVPDSGTAYRGMLGAGLLTAGGTFAVDPVVGALLGGGGAMYSKPLQPALSAIFTKRPELIERYGQQIRGMSPVLTPGLLDVGGRLLKPFGLEDQQ
jgi:hypothetical protein